MKIVTAKVGRNGPELRLHAEALCFDLNGAFDLTLLKAPAAPQRPEPISIEVAANREIPSWYKTGHCLPTLQDALANNPVLLMMLPNLGAKAVATAAHYAVESGLCTHSEAREWLGGARNRSQLLLAWFDRLTAT